MSRMKRGTPAELGGFLPPAQEGTRGIWNDGICHAVARPWKKIAKTKKRDVVVVDFIVGLMGMAVAVKFTRVLVQVACS